MKNNEIIRAFGTDYKDMTKILLRRADLAAEIPSVSAKICIKPNLVSPTPAEFGATTHPEIVAGIIEYLKENGFENITIAEGSWVGDETSEAFEYCGYNALAKAYGIRLIDTKKERAVSIDAAGVDLNICECVRKFDFLINVPVLKGHSQTHITCALKNMKGLIPDSEKRRFHRMGLHKPIAHVNAVIHQDFIIVDHICGDLSFEDGGNPVVRNCIMAAKDPVLIDAYACRLLDIDVKNVPYIRMAEAVGAGSADLSDMKLYTYKGAGCVDNAGIGSSDGAGAGCADNAGIGSSDGAGAGCADSAGIGSSDGAGAGCADSAGIGSSDGAGAGCADNAGIGCVDNAWTCSADGTETDRADSTGAEWAENIGEYGEETSAEHKLLDIRCKIDEVDSCSACYAALVPALIRLKEEGFLEKLKDRISIGQGHQGRTGKIGIGNCTSGFDFCMKGCPPKEDEIYQNLREYIIREQTL